MTALWRNISLSHKMHTHLKIHVISIQNISIWKSMRIIRKNSINVESCSLKLSNAYENTLQVRKHNYKSYNHKCWGLSKNIIISHGNSKEEKHNGNTSNKYLIYENPLNVTKFMYRHLCISSKHSTWESHSDYLLLLCTQF